MSEGACCVRAGVRVCFALVGGREGPGGLRLVAWVGGGVIEELSFFKELKYRVPCKL